MEHPALTRIIALTCLLWSTLPAQEPPFDGTDYLILRSGEEGLGVTEFVRLAEMVTKKSFTYASRAEDKARSHRIRFEGPLKIRRSGFLEFARTRLYLEGFTTALQKKGQVVNIAVMLIDDGPAFDRVARYVEREALDSPATKGEKEVVTPAALTHLITSKAINTLQPLAVASRRTESTTTLKMGAAGRSLLLLRGSREQVRDACRVLELLDAPAATPPRELRLARLRYTRPKDVASKLSTKEQKSASIGVVPLDTCRAIALIGTDAQLADAEKTIRRVDVKQDAK